MEVFVTVPWVGGDLLGILHQVESRSEFGVLFLHGIPGDRVDARRLPVRMARRLQKLGIPSLRVDMFASGITEGSFHEVTMTKQLSQIGSMLDFIRTSKLWEGPTILLAFSESAKLAMIVARERKDVSGICVWNGVVAPEPWRMEVHAAFRFYRFANEMVFDMGYGVWLNRELLKESASLALTDQSEFPDAPMLGVYGGADALTQASPELLRKKGCTIHMIDGCDHLYTSSFWEAELMEVTENWLLCQRGDAEC